MGRDNAVHTVPARSGAGWWNELDGRVVSRHPMHEVAVAVGAEIARCLDVPHVVHGDAGGPAEPEVSLQ